MYEKFKGVEAKQVQSSQEIASILESGKETDNIAEPGDFIVINQTGSQEQYVVKEEEFKKRYTLGRELGDGWGEYYPKGQNKVNGFQLTEKVLKSLKLEKHFYFIADWGSEQYASIGDFIVNPLHSKEVYRIGYDEFKQTYRLLGEE